MKPELAEPIKQILQDDKTKDLVNKGLTGGDSYTNYLLDPMDPVWGEKYKLGPLEEKALDPEWVKANPAVAALNYPGFSEGSKSRRYNSGATAMFRDFVQPYVLNPLGKGLSYTTQFGPVGSALATGGAGYLGGKLVDSLLNKAGINSQFALLLGLLGAGSGYALSGANQKNAKALNMKKDNKFYKFGQAIGFAVKGAHVSTGAVLTSKEDTLKTPETAGYGVMQKNVCKLASDMYAFTNRKHKLEYHIFSKLAHAKRWAPALDAYVDTVYETLATLRDRHTPNLSAVVKSANGILDILTGTAARGAAMTPDVLKTLLGLSAAAGGSLGVAAWLANKHTREDATKNEALKQKISYYNMITDELSDQLKAKGLVVSEEDPELKDKQLV